MYKLSIVIPVFNKVNFTRSCLRDLSKLPNDHEIIVVNNGSKDETESALLSFGSNNKNFLAINLKENLGFAKACNIGYQASSAPNVLFLNNDIKVKDNKENWTQPLIEACNKSLCGPTFGLLGTNNFNFIKESNSYIKDKLSYLSGWCLAGSKANFNKLILKGEEGPFSTEFGLAYHEDSDLSYRSKKINIPLFCINVPVVHFGKQTSSQLNTSLLYTNSKAIFCKKWGHLLDLKKKAKKKFYKKKKNRSK